MGYSQVEVAADARHRGRSCGPSPQVPCNEADAVRSACLNGKKMAVKMKVKTNKNFSIAILYKTCMSLKTKQKIEHRHIFMNRSGQIFSGRKSV